MGQPRAPFLLRVASTVLLLAGSMWAIQPLNLTGDWHLNVEKSRWGSTPKPVSVVVSIDHQEPAIHYRGSVMYANEDARDFAFSGAFDGKPHRMSRSYGEGNITLKRVNATTFESVFHTDDGQYTETTRTSLSADGRTMTRRLTVRSPEGTRSWTEVYEKR